MWDQRVAEISNIPDYQTVLITTKELAHNFFVTDPILGLQD